MAFVTLVNTCNVAGVRAVIEHHRFKMVSRDENISTLEMKINYLKPLAGGDIIAEAKIIHRGTMTAIGDVEVKDGKGNLIAKGLVTYAITKKNNISLQD